MECHGIDREMDWPGSSPREPSKRQPGPQEPARATANPTTIQSLNRFKQLTTTLPGKIMNTKPPKTTEQTEDGNEDGKNQMPSSRLLIMGNYLCVLEKQKTARRIAKNAVFIAVFHNSLSFNTFYLRRREDR